MPPWTRWIGFAWVATLTACGGGGSGGSTSGEGSSSSPGFTVADSGAEPRITLGVGTPRQTLLSIEANASESIDLAGTVTDDSVSASLDLVVELTSSDGGGAELNLIPILESYSPLIDVEGEVVPGAWERRYNGNGVLVDATTTDQNGVFGVQSLGVFLIPALVLSAPAVPVGAGATWMSESPLQAGLVRTTTRLLAVDDTGLQVETSSQFVPVDGSVSASQSTIISALYDRDSLLIRSGTVNSMASFSATVNRNGADAPVTRTRTHQHVFTEVQP